MWIASDEYTFLKRLIAQLAYLWLKYLAFISILKSLSTAADDAETVREAYSVRQFA